MGKFSKTLEKGKQHRDAQEKKDSWLEADSDGTPFIDSIEAGDKEYTSLPNDNPTGGLDDRLFKAVNEDISIPEIFKVLRTHILYPKNNKKKIQTVMITSAEAKEGKSFIAANLGISLAQGMDLHSLLVDCDLRRPSLAKLLGCSNATGLVDYLRDDLDLPELITRTATEKLSILPSGRPPLNPAELLSSARMEDLVKELTN